MRVVSLVPLVLALSLFVSPAHAQDHQHDMSEGMLLIQSDLPEDGRAVAGDIAHFQYVLVDPEGAPFVHHDFHVDITLNGISLYATESAHDYDGVGEIDVVFPVPGVYNVTVTVPIESGELAATYSGYVVPAEGMIPASIRFDGPAQASTGSLATFTYAVVDGNGTLIPHTDALVQVRRLTDDFLVLEAHTHSHTSDMTFDYAFEKSGPHEVRVIGYTAFPDDSAPVFRPVVHRHIVDVAATIPVPALPDAAPRSTAADSHHGHGGAYTTHVTADPVQGTQGTVTMMPTTGPFSQVRASHVTYDANMTLVQHIDYEATLTGPNGVVFASRTLHEYDGVLTLMSANQALGEYTWAFDAAQGEWTDKKGYTYTVAPFLTGRAHGPQFTDVKGVDQLTVAMPRTIEFVARNAAGTPFAHSEIAFEIQDAHGIPLLRQKLHTHASGTFAFQAAMHDGAEHTLRYDLFDIHSSATPSYHGADLDTARAVAFTPTVEKKWPGLEWSESAVVEERNTVPGPALVVLLLAVLALVGMRRRA